MQAIDQEIKELFRILLAINTPFAVQTSTERSECAWSNSLNITLPNASDQIRIKLRQDTFAAFPIVSLHYCLEPVVEEEEEEKIYNVPLSRRTRLVRPWKRKEEGVLL